MNLMRKMFALALLIVAVLFPGFASAGVGGAVLEQTPGVILNTVGTVTSNVGGGGTQLGDGSGVCWKSSYNRGVAGIPSVCNSNEELQAGLCYPKCKDGYKGIGVACWENCPEGYRDDGLTCAKLSGVITRPAYTMERTAAASFQHSASCESGTFYDPRNGGECWSCPGGGTRGLTAVTDSKACYNINGNVFATAPATFHHSTACSNGSFYDPRNGGECWSCPANYNRTLNPVTDAKACSITSSDNPDCDAWAQSNFGTNSCEQIGLLLYPKPPAGTSCTADSCMKNCPSGYRDDGIACAKTTNYTRSVRTPDCPPGQQNQGGLCYSQCKPMYTGVGVVCWGQCASPYPVDCAAGCSTTTLACAMDITGQIVGVLNVVMTTFDTVGSFGSDTALNAVIQKALKEGTEDLIKGIVEQSTKNISEDEFKTQIKSEVKKLGKNAGINLAENQESNLVNMFTGQNFDFTQLDPTGIASMVKSFVHPVCAAPTSTPAPQPQAPPPQFQIVSQANNLCLGQNGSNVALVSCGAANTLWISQSNTLVSASSNLCLTAPGPQMASCGVPGLASIGQAAVLPPQIWQLSGGLVVSIGTGACLNAVPTKQGGPATALVLMPCNPAQATQKWNAVVK